MGPHAYHHGNCHSDLFQRRRTQIRLAQRAYRQRKETTITGLNRRVTSLENTIEDMHKCFLAFNDRVVASGVQHDNLEHLKTTADRLADLVKSSGHVSDAEEEDLDQVLSAQTMEIDETQPRTRRKNAPSEADPAPVLGYHTNFNAEADDDDGEVAQQAPVMQAQLDKFPASDWTSTEAMQHYPIEVPLMNDIASDPFEEAQQYSVPVQDANTMTGFDANDMMQYYLQIPDNTAVQDLLRFGSMTSLPSPKSYATREASFARRLMRTSLEAAYRLMTNPDSRPEAIKRLCKFTWCFAKSDRIADQMKALIERTAKQSLELWEAPTRHIGGAGLHYPRVGIDVADAPPEWWAHQAPIGPTHIPQPETPVPDSLMIDQIAERVGQDGEWFDSNDVEQYLRSKGLYLDGQSSIVELNDDETVPALIDTQGPSANSPAASSSHDSTGGPRSPQITDVNGPSDPFLHGTDFLWSGDTADMSEIQDLNMDLLWGDIDYSNPKTFPPGMEFSLFSNTIPTFNTKMKKFVDVEKFVNSACMIVTTLPSED